VVPLGNSVLLPSSSFNHSSTESMIRLSSGRALGEFVAPRLFSLARVAFENINATAGPGRIGIEIEAEA
jgi:hypothetical protein